MAFLTDPAFLTSATAILVAAVTGAFTVWGGKRKASADMQGSLNAGFDILIRELQEERADLMRIIKEQADEIQRLKGEPPPALPVRRRKAE